MEWSALFRYLSLAEILHSGVDALANADAECRQFALGFAMEAGRRVFAGDQIVGDPIVGDIDSWWHSRSELAVKFLAQDVRP